MLFNGRQEEKILSWREFRNTLTEFPAGINKTATAWANAPLINNYLSFDTIEEWPDAWTLISDGYFCNVAVALGMFYTLYYSKYEHKDTMQIKQFKLAHEHTELNLLFCENGKYVLNYSLGEAVNIEQILSLPTPSYIVSASDLTLR